MYLQVGAPIQKLLFGKIAICCYLVFEVYKEDYFLKVLRVYRNIKVFPKCIFNTLVWWNSCVGLAGRNTIALETLFDLVFRHKQAIVCAKSNIDEKIIEFLAS